MSSFNKSMILLLLHFFVFTFITALADDKGSNEKLAKSKMGNRKIHIIPCFDDYCLANKQGSGVLTKLGDDERVAPTSNGGRNVAGKYLHCWCCHFSVNHDTCYASKEECWDDCKPPK